MSHLYRRAATLLLCSVALLCSACGAMPAPTLKISEESNRNVRYGMPGKASRDESNKTACLIDRSQYVLSYSNESKNPNWVSWQLVRADIGGPAERGDKFTKDVLLPKSFVHVSDAAYTGSGFDRGHMCPAADRTATQEDSDATFYMTNIIPQAPTLNRKPWERMESYCRSLAKKGGELHICCGPLGTGGTGAKGYAERIGAGKGITNVPAKCWKVVMVVPDGERPSETTRTFAVVIPNSEDVDLQWPIYRTSVQKIEELTGLSFWPNLPAEVGQAIKSRVDDAEIKVEPFKK